MAPFGTTRMDGNPLTVAGAATVLDPLRVVRTVFPFRPFAFDSGNRHRQIKARPSRRQAGKDGSQSAETREQAYEISAPVRSRDFGRDRLGEMPVIGEEKHTEPVSYNHSQKSHGPAYVMLLHSSNEKLHENASLLAPAFSFQPPMSSLPSIETGGVRPGVVETEGCRLAEEAAEATPMDWYPSFA